MTSEERDTVRLVFPRTGEIIDVDGSDSAEAKAQRQNLYRQGWKRERPKRQIIRACMYECKHKRAAHIDYAHQKILQALDDVTDFNGLTCAEITTIVQTVYDTLTGAEHREEDSTTTRATNVDTHDYLLDMGYVADYLERTDGWHTVYVKEEP